LHLHRIAGKIAAPMAPTEIYRRITSMEPLLPASNRGRLAELSAEIFRKSGELKAALPSIAVRKEIARLVAAMNSYYSNLIEGHKTLPKDIERALHADFSSQPEERRNQLLSVAHIQAEELMRRLLEEDASRDIHTPDFVRWLHDMFYRHLPEAERFTISPDGSRHPLVPGQFRDYNVGVGRHTPPDYPTLDAFMARFEAFYSDSTIPATDRLIATAAAHHRLAWIHPFGDGNGRVARLQSQAALIRAGVDGDGLWSLSRGLARSRGDYYANLAGADQKRAGDHDGRGNLSDRALAAFCEYFLRQVLDQIEFMSDAISPFTLQERVAFYCRGVRTDLEPRLREHLAKLLSTLVMEGSLARGSVPGILGLGASTGREVIRVALRENLVSSPSPKGPLGIAFRAGQVEFYFPGLFTELAL